MKSRNRIWHVIGTLVLHTLLGTTIIADGFAAEMNDYCLIPPTVSQVKPNLLLLLDNSASQYDLAYTDTSSSATDCYDDTYKNDRYCTVTKTIGCASDSDCTGNGQACVDSVCAMASDRACRSNGDCGSAGNAVCASPYQGYFDPDDYYASVGTTFTTDLDPFSALSSSFTPLSGSWPLSGCGFQTDYLCITTAGTGTRYSDVVEFAAKGSFLNWLSASKMDVQKKILTGGKFDPSTGTLTSEGRGCSGRTFVKSVPDGDWIVKPKDGMITFGVRGDLSADPQARATGGITRIDVFSGEFNQEACKKAVVNQEQENQQPSGDNTASQALASCLGEAGSLSGDGIPLPWNAALHACWKCDPPCAAGRLNDDNIRDVKNACEQGLFSRGHQPSAIMAWDRNAVCLSDSAFAVPSTDLTGVAGGYVGVCWDGTAWKGDSCVKQKLAAYCDNFTIGNVTDPSGPAAGSTRYRNAAEELITAGLFGQLGNPIRSFPVKIMPRDNSAVSGVVQQLKNSVRLGFMIFNSEGSAYECKNLSATDSLITRCSATSNKDGGFIPAGGYIGDPAGDHTTGMIRAIDDSKGDTWTPLSEAFYDAIGYLANRSDGYFPISAGAYDTSKKPVQSSCQQNNILIMSDGRVSADLHNYVTRLVAGHPSDGQYDAGASNDASCATRRFGGSRNLNDLAALAHAKKIKTLAPGFTEPGTRTGDTVRTSVVYLGTDTGGTDECNPKVLMQNTATQGGGRFYAARGALQAASDIAEAAHALLAGSGSGSAAAILATNAGAGANILETNFYPGRQFANSTTGGYDSVAWTGRIADLWYVLDPASETGGIREDNGITSAGTNSAPSSGDKKLDLKAVTSSRGDYIVNLRYDTAAGMVKADRWADPAGSGTTTASLPVMPTIALEDVDDLWEAGAVLWKTGHDLRTIKTTTGSGLIDFTPASAPTLSVLMQTASSTANVISWISGSDVAGFRSRTVKIETIDAKARVWKLGDVIHGTPKILSWQALNSYGSRYSDGTYGNGGSPDDAVDGSHFTTTEQYKARGMVFAAANDGMLHAFKLGTLQLKWDGQSGTEKAKLLVDRTSGTLCSSGTGSAAATCGKEQWAFIPKNALPYLKYLADPDYCHLYTVDLMPLMVDASIHGGPDDRRTVTSWRTVLIGGMGLGGACRDADTVCTDCVKTPSSGTGYSSYFALDVTDPEKPVLLWEFSHPSLGFATSGVSIVRINGKTSGAPDSRTNGNWFAVIGSGPTGPISTTDHQFLGRSDQDLALFVLDLRGPAGGSWTEGVDYWVKRTKVPLAFSGSLLSGPLDVDNDYEDEVLYIPFVQKNNAANAWTGGGVGRLMTLGKSDPGQWSWSLLADPADGVGPVTAGVAKIYDASDNSLWVYFGEGRYFFNREDEADDPDASPGRRLIAVRDPCVSEIAANTACSSGAELAGLRNVTSASAASVPEHGWFVSLERADSVSGLYAERLITDPVASASGVVYFATYKPYTDPCQYGGKTALWAFRYATAETPNALRGKAVIQTSTGSIEQRDLSVAFTRNGNRKSADIEGKPPDMQGLSVVTMPQPVNRIVHVRER